MTADLAYLTELNTHTHTHNTHKRTRKYTLTGLTDLTVTDDCNVMTYFTPGTGQACDIYLSIYCIYHIMHHLIVNAHFEQTHVVFYTINNSHPFRVCFIK